MEKFERLVVGFGALVCQHYQIGRQLANDVEHGSVAGCLLAEITGESLHLTMKCGDRQRRLLKRQPFNGFSEVVGDRPALAGIQSALFPQLPVTLSSLLSSVSPAASIKRVTSSRLSTVGRRNGLFG